MLTADFSSAAAADNRSETAPYNRRETTPDNQRETTPDNQRQTTPDNQRRKPTRKPQSHGGEQTAIASRNGTAPGPCRADAFPRCRGQRVRLQPVESTRGEPPVAGLARPPVPRPQPHRSRAGRASCPGGRGHSAGHVDDSGGSGLGRLHSHVSLLDPRFQSRPWCAGKRRERRWRRRRRRW